MGQIIKRRWVKNGLGIEKITIVGRDGRVMTFESSESLSWWYFEYKKEIVKIKKSKDYEEAVKIFEEEY